MRKILAAVVALLLMLCVSALAETAYVTTEEEFMQALADEAYDEIIVEQDIELTDTYIWLEKDVVVNARLVFHPAPEEGSFFVKSFEIPEGITVTLTSEGSLFAECTYGDDFVLAQIYVNGGSLLAEDGRIEEGMTICFNAGELTIPEDCPENVDISRYLYEEYDADDLQAAFDEPALRSLVLQAPCVIDRDMTVPSGLHVNVQSEVYLRGAILTVEDGAVIDGENIIVIPKQSEDPEEYTAGYRIYGNGRAFGYSNNPEWSVYKEFLFNRVPCECYMEYDANGVCTFMEMYDPMIEDTMYRRIGTEEAPVLECWYSNYVELDDTGFRWQHDYIANVGEEIWYGTEGFTGRGEFMLCVFNEFRTDSGEYEYEEWYNDNEYFYYRYNENGNLIRYGTCYTLGEEINKWELDDGVLMLPEETHVIGEEAFKDVEAKIVVLPMNVYEIGEGAIDEDVLVVVYNGSNILGRVQELGLNYIYMSDLVRTTDAE